ncbi:hypothetical protein BH18ACT10_BH18ACT10_15220 [soil metagenome]
MRSLGRTLRARPALLYAMIAVLVVPLLLAVVSGASPSSQTGAVIFLAVGASVLVRAYRGGDGQ